MKTHSVFHWALTLATGALLTACGNIGSQYGAGSYADALNYGPVDSTTSGGGLNSAQGLYQCPSQGSSNVVPTNFQSFYGGSYRVCVDPNSQADIQVSGAARNFNQICVFPGSVTQQGVSWMPNPNAAGAPWYVCQAASTSGVIFTFQGASYNAAFVVDSTDVQWMQACLINGAGTTACPYFPDYSYGQFR